MRLLPVLLIILSFISGVHSARAEDFVPDNAIPPKVENTAGRVANLVRDNVQASLRHFKNWWDEGAVTYGPPKVVPSTYCYRAQGDALCYGQPVPGWEHRLIGYQGTDAAPPPPVVTERLPSQAADNRSTAAARISVAAPVFIEMPPETKEAPKADIPPEAPENVHETITDPTLSPQL